MGDLQEQVQGLLDGLIDSGTGNGLQAAVYRRGEVMVDAVAGVADPETDRPVTPETVFYCASAMKGVTATVVHVLVERRVFDYGTRVVEVWPEFGAHGKESTTLRHVLTHSAGVPALPADLAVEGLCDWDHMCGLIADATPWWVPGEQVGYHAMTQGFILGEIVRRATGQPIPRVLADELGGPLGVSDELFFGVPATALGRVARLEDDPTGAAVFASLPTDFPLFKSGPRAIFPSAALANRPEVIAADIPSMGTASARGLARTYAALMDEVDGVRLVSPDRLTEITTQSTTGCDVLTGGPGQYGLGYTVGFLGSAPAAPSVFGMVGMGGSACYADTATGITVAVTKNRFNPIDLNAYEQVHALVVAALS